MLPSTAAQHDCSCAAGVEGGEVREQRVDGIRDRWRTPGKQALPKQHAVLYCMLGWPVPLPQWA